MELQKRTVLMQLGIMSTINRQVNAKSTLIQESKQAKIKELDAKVKSLEKELKAVKNNKNMTNTEKTIKSRALERQINFYNKQLEALK